jgi:drug/metabolite transporter (DMT)-like permease
MMQLWRKSVCRKGTSMNLKTVTYLILLGMIWGSSFLFQRITVPAMGAGITASGRVLLAALALLALLAATGRKTNFRERWRDYLLIGLGGAGLPFVAFAFAAYFLPAGYSAVLNATVPLFTVLLGWVGGPRPSTSKLVGVVVGVLGVVTLARFGTVTLNWMTLLAFAGGLAAAVLYAFNARIVRERFADTDPLVVAAGGMIGATLPLLPWGVAVLPTVALPSTGVLLALAALGVLCTGVAYAMYYRLIQDAGSERAVTVTFIVPLFAQAWGALFIGEAITWASAIGCALVLFAVALIFERVPGLKPKPRVVVPALCEARR